MGLFDFKNPFDNFDVSTQTENQDIKVPETEQPIEGSACTTKDGLRGTIVDGKCRPIDGQACMAEKGLRGTIIDGSCVPDDGQPCMTNAGKAGTIQNGSCVANPEPEEDKAFDFNKQESAIQVPDFARWLYQDEGQYNTPLTPQKYMGNNATIPVYSTYGIPLENAFGTLFGEAQEGFTKPSAVPSNWLDHNVPLAVWLPDGSVYKANNPDEFRQLVQFVEQNKKYLPSVSEFPGSSGKANIKTFADLQFYVSEQQRLDTPERQEYETARLNESRLSNYQQDIIQYKLHSDNPISVTTPEGIIPIENLSDLQRLSGDALESAMNQLYLSKSDLNPSEDEQSKFGRLAFVYLDRLQRAQRRGTGSLDVTQVSAEVEAKRQKYYDSITSELPNDVSAVPNMVDGKPEGGVTVNIDGWQATPDGWTSPDGKQYTELELVDNPEFQASFMKNITDEDIESLMLALEQQMSLTGYMIDALGKIGDSAFSRALIKKLDPEVTDEDISETFELYKAMTTEPSPWQFETGGRVRMAEEGTPLYYIQNSVFGFMFPQPKNDAEAALWLFLLAIGEASVGAGIGGGGSLSTLPLTSISPKAIRTLFAFNNVPTELAGGDYFADFVGLVSKGIQKGAVKAGDFVKRMITSALKQGKQPTEASKVLSEISGITKKEADDIVADLVQQINDPEKIVLPRTKISKPGEILEEGMVKQADGTFTKVENATYEKIKPGDVIPEQGSPDRIDLPNGETYIVKPKATAKPPEAQIKPQAVEAGKTQAKQPQTPVQSEGKLQQSKYYQRVNEGIERDVANDPVYNRMNLQQDTENAVKFVNDAPNDAKQIALGLRKPPNNVTNTAVRRAYIEKVRETMPEIADDLEQRLSLKLTREGQEIVAARGMNDNSVSSALKEATSNRMAQVGEKLSGSSEKTAKARVKDVMAKEVNGLSTRIKKANLKIEDINKIIDSLICGD